MAEEFRTPQSANEALLQNILGAENEIREPQSVTEYYLKKIWEEGTGGGDLYYHNIRLYYGSACVAQVTIVNSVANKFTKSTLLGWFIDNGFDRQGNMYNATGFAYQADNGLLYETISGIYASNDKIAVETNKVIINETFPTGIITNRVISVSNWSVNDTVIKI